MTVLTTQLPAHCADLVIRPIGEGGRYVVKLPGTHDYFQLGEEEHFLLLQLDGKNDIEAVCSAFETRFGEPLVEDELHGFIELARERQLIGNAGISLRNVESDIEDTTRRSALAAPCTKQSLLYWRKNIFDPDRLFNWLEPKVRFFWTRGFLALSALCILSATLVLWTGRE